MIKGKSINQIQQQKNKIGQVTKDWGTWDPSEGEQINSFKEDSEEDSDTN